MDTELRSDQGITLIEFKVTSQQDPSSFSLSDVRDILQNATLAILNHERDVTSDPINAFILASNRPIGKQFTELQEARRNIGADTREFFTKFANEPASSTLFSESKGKTKDKGSTARTMFDFARSVTRGKASQWGVDSRQCAEACLKAISRFAFAEANPAQLGEALRGWFRKWGILPGEDDKYMASILGALLLQSQNGMTCDELSIMRRVFDSPMAVPITARSIWQSVVDDLRASVWKDPPTQSLIPPQGFVRWMLNRSDLLRRLPYDFVEDIPADPDPDPEDPYYASGKVPPRIFVLVGSGGVGKTALMTNLFVQVAGVLWDWETGIIREAGVFRGCPIIKNAAVNALDGIASALMKWGGRKEILEYPVERLAAAYQIGASDPAVWLGIDGLDEVCAI
jgi:hypothetical protein